MDSKSKPKYSFTFNTRKPNPINFNERKPNPKFVKFNKFDTIGRNPGIVKSCKVGNIQWQGQKQPRGGVLPYFKYDNDTYFILGRDLKSNDLAGFLGGIKKYENRIDGSLREFREESMGVFEKYLPEIDMSDQTVLYSDKMLMILVQFPIMNSKILIDEFQQLVKNEIENKGSRPEMSDLIVVPKKELLDMIELKDVGKLISEKKILYTKDRYFLQEVIDVITSI
jgi:hypothetical protein